MNIQTKEERKQERDARIMKQQIKAWERNMRLQQAFRLKPIVQAVKIECARWG